MDRRSQKRNQRLIRHPPLFIPTFDTLALVAAWSCCTSAVRCLNVWIHRTSEYVPFAVGTCNQAHAFSCCSSAILQTVSLKQENQSQQHLLHKNHLDFVVLLINQIESKKQIQNSATFSWFSNWIRKNKNNCALIFMIEKSWLKSDKVNWFSYS